MLHNGETFWDKINPKSKGYPPAEGLLSCDVLVAGGGMSGMLTARTLAKNGYDCIVIDEQTAIECDHIVYTTGYTENRFTDNLGSYADLVRSFALVTKPVSPDKEMPTDAMIWDAKRPYLYVRTCPGRRMLIGGLDEDQKEIPSEARMKKRAEELIDELNKLFPGYDFETEFIWGARFGESGDGLPFIGKIPGEKNRYLLLGYGGNGTVYSSIGSSVIMNCIEGREDIYASLFDPGRVVQEKII